MFVLLATVQKIHTKSSFSTYTYCTYDLQVLLIKDMVHCSTGEEFIVSLNCSNNKPYVEARLCGRRGKYVSISKQTSLENFVQSSALLRLKFGATYIRGVHAYDRS